MQWRSMFVTHRLLITPQRCHGCPKLAHRFTKLCLVAHEAAGLPVRLAQVALQLMDVGSHLGGEGKHGVKWDGKGRAASRATPHAAHITSICVFSMPKARL